VTPLLALASAVLVGASDFLAGVVSRRSAPVRVAALAQFVSFALSLPVAAAVGADRVTTGDAGWSAASGVAVAAGLTLFYTAMRRGLISLVAPIAAVTGASVPVAYALSRGERPGAAALTGIALALPAIAIVSIAPGRGARTAGADPVVIALAVAAGALFGLFFVCLAHTSSDAGLWPVAISRFASTAALSALVLALGRPANGAPARPAAGAVLAIGALELAATVTLVLALQRGPLAIASVLASLYPVTTVMLAAAVLRERLTRLQLTGVALALAAVGLVSTA